MTEAVIAYVIANLLDIASTNLVLKRGGRELNPILRWAMEALEGGWPLVKIGFAGAALALLTASFDEVWPIWAGAAVYGLVAINNFRVARRMK